MPGQYAARGGILDVYSPEADVRCASSFSGIEIESMRKFDTGKSAIFEPSR